MEQDLLKKLRIIVPGCIILFALLSVIVAKITVKDLFSTIAIVDIVYFTLIVFALGAIYHLFNIRSHFNRSSIERIDSNIKSSLLEPFRNDHEISNKSETLKKGRTLMSIFYQIVDNDNSLTAKAKNVRFNGIFLSSVADLIFISFLAIVMHFVCYEIWKSNYNLALIFVWLGIYILAYVLLPKVTKRHIDLSNEQLDFIRTHYSDKLKEKIKEAIKSQQNNGRKSK
jgi:hypothetical protein